MGTLTTMTAEGADLLESLQVHRAFLRQTLVGITDEQARLRPTASTLSLGGLLKHVSLTEARRIDFILDGHAVMAMTPESYADHSRSFELQDGETVAGLLEEYDRVAARTAEVLASLPDLDAVQTLRRTHGSRPKPRPTPPRTQDPMTTTHKPPLSPRTPDRKG